MQSLADICEILPALLTKSGKASHSSRKALCNRIGVDPDGLDFLDRTAAEDFACQLVDLLVKTDDRLGIIKLTLVIKPKLKGQLSAELEGIQVKLLFQVTIIAVFPQSRGKFLFYLLYLAVIQANLISQIGERLITNLEKNTSGSIDFLSTLLTGMSVTALVILVRYLGGMQPLELFCYDLFMKLKFPEEPDEHILVVEVTDEELKNSNGETISDRRVLQLLKELKKVRPRVIGLDILRDIPQPYNGDKSQSKDNSNDNGDKNKSEDDHNALIKYLNSESQNNIFGICKFAESSTDEGSKVPYTEMLRLGRIGFNNVLPDGSNTGIIRRHLLKVYNSNSSECTTDYSLSYLVAKRYLELSEERVDWLDDYLEIGEGKTKTIFYPLIEPDLGGYQGENLDLSGYQVLLHYRSANFDKISLHDFFNDLSDKSKIDDLLKKFENRIVLIGYTGKAAIARKDVHPTPVGQEMPGVILHAHMISQIINAALEPHRPLLLPLLWIEEVFWISVCSLLGGLLVQRTRSQQSLLMIIIGILSLIVICYFSFMGGVWLPMVPSTLAFALTSKIIEYRTLQED